MNPSAPIFPTQNYFRWKYLRTTFVSVSLSFKYLVRVENMQLNYHLCCLDFSGSLFWFGDELTTSIKTKLQIFGKGKKECKYFQILKVHFHNEGGLGPNFIFSFFSDHHKKNLHAKFQGGLTPPSSFLPIYIPFWQICDEYIYTKEQDPFAQVKVIKRLPLWAPVEKRRGTRFGTVPGYL